MISIPSSWLNPANLSEAPEVQRLLGARVVKTDDLVEVKSIAGVDISHNPRDPEKLVFAGIAILDPVDKKLRTESQAIGQAIFPYIPGFLGFREVPTLLEAYKILPEKPDLIFVDGHGVSHPRGLGIASHLGVLLDTPTIGVAKSILVGKIVEPLADEVGSQAPLVWRDQVIGRALRLRRRAKPVFVSTGHRISLESAVEWVLKMATGYRLPEPTRQAHQAANRARKKYYGERLTREIK